MRALPRSPLWALLSLCLLCSLLSLLVPLSVHGAGHSTQTRPVAIPRHWGHPASFPSAEDIENDANLYERFGGENKINLHVVPHTHDDVGWLKTVDQYYLGANNSIQHAAVRHILDTVVEQLQLDASRKFIYVEQAFFQMWWQRQTAAVQKIVRGLVASGQLEFINGGWCMHDEANTYYLDMVDQTTLGHQYLLQQFGVTPKVQWQIDPFGHSSTQASLLSAEVGYEALFFGRIDHEDHDTRMRNKNMEFVWRASPSLGANAEIFTGAFQSGNYGPPSGFCYDWFCGDQPMITDSSFIDYNVPERVEAFLNQINYQAAFTLGSTLMVTMGSDFQYENAREWYQNLDALMEAVNKDGRINMFYSTPSQYVEAKNKEGLKYTTKTDDFFPYSDDEHAYWTGYFTSRPALKRYVRSSSALLQAARQLELFQGGDGSASLPFEQAVAIAQHHDAVAGTSKQHVAEDYAQRLHIAQTQAQEMMAASLADWTVQGAGSGASRPRFVFCELANISVCAATADVSQPIQLLLYNPLARARTEVVSVPVATAGLVVLDQSAKPVQAQVTSTYNVSSHTSDSLPLELHFRASVPGLGFKSYFIQPPTRSDQVYYEARHSGRVQGKGKRSSSRARRVALQAASTFVSEVVSMTPGAAAADVTLENEAARVIISGETGLVSTLLDKVSGVSVPLDVSYGYYNSYAGDGQKSGAYIFRPAQQRINRLSVQPRLLVQQGPLVQQATQLLNLFLNHTIRLVSGRPAVELHYAAGSIPIEDGVGKELAIQYGTGLRSGATWYSDSNGREMVQRVRNHRDTWNYTVTEEISGNYVPMTMASYLSDGKTQFTVLNDRAQGCVSMADGTIEVMIHRRTLQDDARGVGEALNETSRMSHYPNPVRFGPGLIISGTHFILLGNASAAASVWRPLAQRVYAPLVHAYADLEPGQTPAAYVASHATTASHLRTDLPDNVDLVSLQAWGIWAPKNEEDRPRGKGGLGAPDQEVLLRLAHMFAVDEDPSASKPVSVDLATLFQAPPTSVRMMSLTANKEAKDVKRGKLVWNTHHNEENLESPPPVSLSANGVVTLSPMQIQTFLLTF